MLDQTLRILIVEDDALTAAAFAAALRDDGHKIVGIADTAQDAIAQAATQQADLALVDLTLSDGPTGLLAAKALNDNFVVPSLLISGDTNLDAKAAAVRALGFIPKPADANEVVRTVALLLEHRALAPLQRR
jgi:DNA-binding NarL/FixJ family response regulator